MHAVMVDVSLVAQTDCELVRFALRFAHQEAPGDAAVEQILGVAALDRSVIPFVRVHPHPGQAGVTPVPAGPATSGLLESRRGTRRGDEWCGDTGEIVSRYPTARACPHRLHISPVTVGAVAEQSELIIYGEGGRSK